MKKVKFLALAMVFAIMLMGVGYAAWNDVITISTTVKTGNLDVQFVPAPGTTGSPGPAIAATDTGSQINGLNAVVDPSNPDVLNVTAQNLYPGAKFYVTAVAKNKGTIEAKLDGIKIATTATGDNRDLLDELKITAGYYAEIAADIGSDYVEIIGERTIGSSEAYFEVTPGNSLPIETIDFNGDLIRIEFEWPMGDTHTDVDHRDLVNLENVNFTIDFNWVQFNK